MSVPVVTEFRGGSASVQSVDCVQQGRHVRVTLGGTSVQVSWSAIVSNLQVIQRRTHALGQDETVQGKKETPSGPSTAVLSHPVNKSGGAFGPNIISKQHTLQ